MTNRSELEQKIFSLTVETGRKFMKTRVLEDWTLSKQIMELVNAYITANYTPKDVTSEKDYVTPTSDKSEKLCNQSELEQFIRKHTFADFAPGGDGSDVVMVDPEVLADCITTNYTPNDRLEDLLIDFAVAVTRSRGFPSDPEQFYEHDGGRKLVKETLAELTEALKNLKEAA